MLVCVDKITCARMLMLIEPKWKAQAAKVRAEAGRKLDEIATAADDETRQRLHAQRDRLLAKATWLDETIIEIIISEAQKEVEDFKKWGFDIIPHRSRMKLGFETPDGKRIDVESAFKNPQHQFRVAKRPRGRLAGGFRIVTVQQILPRSKDFTKADPTLSNIRARSDDRDHLSRISLLTYRTLVAKLKADNDDSKVGADLIVFPEVAIHPDDQDILKRLADKTKAIIFAGLIFQDHEGKLVNVARWFIPDYRLTGRRWIIRDQGKRHMTAPETALGISGHRPCQHIIEIVGDKEGPFKLSGAICYDATDLKLAADLKGKTDLFIVSAHNRDVATFDTMASALNYHMYQHVALVNKGEFGGTTIQAPYREHFDRLISHAHGSDQISINVADLDLAAFRRDHRTHKPVKKRPAGMNNFKLDAE